MRTERLHQMAVWLQELTLSVSELFRIREPVMVPARIEESCERGLFERQSLLARTRPRQPPYQ